MARLGLLYGILAALTITIVIPATSQSDVKLIKAFLKEYNKEGDELQRNDTLASWKYEIDMTNESKAETIKWSAITSKFAIENRKKAKELLKDLDGDIPKSMMRQLNLIKRTASSSNSADNKEVANLQSKMTSIYSKTVVSDRFLRFYLFNRFIFSFCLFHLDFFLIGAVFRITNGYR